MSIFGNKFSGPYNTQPPQPSLSNPGGPKESVQRVESEILAWRGWNFDATDLEPILYSASREVRWEGPTLVADKPPVMGGTHGIYALKKKGGSDYFRLAAYGQVALSGLVVEGEDGYRAERATIRSLWVANPACFGPVGNRLCAWEIVGHLEQRYDVDVQVATDDWEVNVEISNTWQYSMQAGMNQYTALLGGVSGLGNVLRR